MSEIASKENIFKLKNNEKTKAVSHLIIELEEGRKAGAEHGWIPSNEVRKHFKNVMQNVK